MRRAALLTAVLVFVAGGLAWFSPWLLERREIVVATPVAAPLFQAPALIELRPGSRACAFDVGFDPDADQLRFRAGTFGRPGEPLAVELQAGGYRETALVAAGYPDNATLSVAVAPPPRPLIGRVCIANRGDARVALYGNDEQRTRSQVVVQVDGRPVEADVLLSFWESGKHTRAAQLPEAIDRMALFRPVGPWFAWLLLALVLLGVPALSIWALQRAFAQPNADTSRTRSASSRE